MFAERMSKFNLLVNFVVKLREHSQNVRLMFKGLSLCRQGFGLS